MPVADVQVSSTSLIMSDGVKPVHSCVILVGRLHTFPTVTPALAHALADDLIGCKVVDLQHDFRLVEIPAAVVGRNAAVQRHRDDNAGKDRFPLIGHAHLIAGRERQLGCVLVPRRDKRLKRQLCRQRVEVVRQRHVTRKCGDIGAAVRRRGTKSACGHRHILPPSAHLLI